MYIKSLNIFIPIELTTSLLRNYPKEIIINVYKYLGKRTFLTALLITVKGKSSKF